MRSLAVVVFTVAGCGVAFDSAPSSSSGGGGEPGAGGGGSATSTTTSSIGAGAGGSKACEDPAVTGEYVVHALAGTIAIDGRCDDASWVAAPLAPWIASNNNTDIASVSCRFLWEDGAVDRFYGCCDVADSDINADHTALDDPIWEDDGIEFFLTSHQMPSWQPTSLKTFVSPNATVRDADWSSGVCCDTSYDGSVVAVAVVDGTLTSGDTDISYTLEWSQDLGWDAAPESLAGCAFRINDRDGDDATFAEWQAFGETLHVNEPAGLHRCKLSCASP